MHCVCNLVRMGLAESRAIRPFEVFKSTQDEEVQLEIQTANSGRNALHRPVDAFTAHRSLANGQEADARADPTLSHANHERTNQCFQTYEYDPIETKENPSSRRHCSR